MIGRGAYGRPWFLRQVIHWLKTGERLPDPPLAEQYAILLRALRGHADPLRHRARRCASRASMSAGTPRACPGSAEFRVARSMARRGPGARRAALIRALLRAADRAAGRMRAARAQRPHAPAPGGRPRSAPRILGAAADCPSPARRRGSLLYRQRGRARSSSASAAHRARPAARRPAGPGHAALRADRRRCAPTGASVSPSTASRSMARASAARRVDRARACGADPGERGRSRCTSGRSRGKIDRQLTHRSAARSVTAMAAMLAHEVKNPLSGIRGAAQLLEQNAVGGRPRADPADLRRDRPHLRAGRPHGGVLRPAADRARGRSTSTRCWSMCARVAQSGFARDIALRRALRPVAAAGATATATS